MGYTINIYVMEIFSFAVRFLDLLKAQIYKYCKDDHRLLYIAMR